MYITFVVDASSNSADAACALCSHVNVFMLWQFQQVYFHMFSEKHFRSFDVIFKAVERFKDIFILAIQIINVFGKCFLF